MSKIEIKIKTPLLVPCYQGYVIEDFKIKPSIKIIQERLKKFGMRPINNVIDATNYVTLELGQPLHAFDLDKIKGPMIVRESKAGEVLSTLDDKKHRLDGGDIVIENNGELIDLAGIMGGKSTGILKTTKAIFLQAAVFDPVSIRRTSKALKQPTLASHIYERGVDPELSSRALKRAAELIGGRVVEEIKLGDPPEKKRLEFDFASLESCSKKEAVAILRNLGFEVAGNLLTVPSWRLDINIPEDIAEEVYRLYGYDKIRPELPKLELRPPEKDELEEWSWRIRDNLASAGFTEVFNYAFSDEKGGLKIAGQNKYLRVSLIPGLKKNLEENGRNFSEVRIFEIGKVFDQRGERWMLGIAGHDYLEVKGALLYIFGEIEVLDRICEFDLEAIIRQAPKDIRYKPISRFPGVKRDIAIMMSQRVSVGEVAELIKKTGGRLLEEVELFDVYSLKDDQKSLAFHLFYEDSKKTLTDKEVNDLHKKIEKEIERTIENAKIR